MFGKKGISTQNIADALNLLEKYLIDHNLKLSGYMSVVNGAREELALIKKYAATNLAHHTEIDEIINDYEEHERTNGRIPTITTSCYGIVSWLIDKHDENKCKIPAHFSCKYSENNGTEHVCTGKKEVRDVCPFHRR